MVAVVACRLEVVGAVGGSCVVPRSHTGHPELSCRTAQRQQDRQRLCHAVAGLLQAADVQVGAAVIVYTAQHQTTQSVAGTAFSWPETRHGSAGNPLLRA